MRRDAELAQDGVIGLDRVDRADLALDDQAEELDEGELVLGMVDLAAEEGHPGPVFLGVGQKLKGVAGGAGRAAQDADDRCGSNRTSSSIAFGPW